VSLLSKHWVTRIAAVGALCLALGLSACGRKGPLDPPPGAAQPTIQATQQQTPLVTPLTPLTPDGIPLNVPAQRLPGDRGVSAPPPTGQRPHFLLDFLID
jgi:predicted small lipoprotein YifL